jgi:hypothetical protein
MHSALLRVGLQRAEDNWVHFFPALIPQRVAHALGNVPGFVPVAALHTFVMAKAKCIDSSAWPSVRSGFAQNGFGFEGAQL